jgi:hypothetical protein
MPSQVTLLVGAISHTSFEHEHEDEHLVAATPRVINAG